MNTFKNWLLSSMGFFGFIVYYAFMIFIAFCPFYFLPLPFVLSIIVCLVLQFMPALYTLTSPIAWIWSFFIVIKEPISPINIAYYICLAIWILIVVVPFILQMLKK
jgi:hypothetical protein